MRLVTLGFIVLCGLGSANAATSPTQACPHDVINPATDVNWNDAFPIVVGGVTTPTSRQAPQPAMMKEPAVCVCPGRGLESVGVGLTYWVPEFLAEVENTAGCMPSLSTSVSLPPVAGVLATSSQGENAQPSDARQMQVHWYKFPLFAMMDLFNTLACANTGGDFAVVGLSETEPFWHDAWWADIINPETFLYANPVAEAACIPDAVASTVHLPLDVLNWCVGAQGGLYPITGAATNSTTDSRAGGNLLILAKYMQQLSRAFLLQSTIGPWATCHSTPLPNLIRSQYRIDPVKPVHTNAFVRFGKWDSTWNETPPLNPGLRYDNTFLIWQGEQCCAF